jgi:hypothetical protein
VRQAILVIFLVGAAFLGGAFVNGPGLHWAQARLIRSLGLTNGGEIASIDLKPTGGPEAISDGVAPAKPIVNMPPSPRPTVPAAALESQPSGLQPKGSQAMSAPSDPDVTPAILDSLAALLPSSPSPPHSGSSMASAAPKPGGKERAPWSTLERKMQALGVSRFMIDGEVGGQVVFSCLIPIAGRQAVTQRFEAGGDDIAQAADATLRRIGLWRAAQAASK